MGNGKFRIGVVAPASRITPELAERAAALAATLYPGRVEIVFHPQCFLISGHFAGGDAERAQAFLDIANDPSFDALWMARGGYGANRILERVMARLTRDAEAKTYMGYSDGGFLLAPLYGRGFRVAHGPIPADLNRLGGEAAVTRGLRWLVDGARDALEPTLDGKPAAAFNLTILSHLIGTPYLPDLAGHVLMIEDVSEHHYRVDRALFHVTSTPELRKIAGLRLGRISDVPPNDPAFGETDEQIARHWCARSGIAFLGHADIGHDVENKVVPFGTTSPSPP
ncbi:MAG TPA: LD-carboxypeptidase [Rhizomicrobium sp.]|jgi:muramoyltetrapeptide carboxypeptidase